MTVPLLQSSWNSLSSYVGNFWCKTIKLLYPEQSIQQHCDNIIADQIYDEPIECLISGYCKLYCNPQINATLDDSKLYSFGLIKKYYHHIIKISKGTCLSYGACSRNSIRIDHRLRGIQNCSYLFADILTADDENINLNKHIDIKYFTICVFWLYINIFLIINKIIYKLFKVTIAGDTNAGSFEYLQSKYNKWILGSCDMICFNQYEKMIQRWCFVPIKIKKYGSESSDILSDPNKPGYICKIIYISDICKFNDLTKVCYEAPYNSRKDKHDGLLTFYSPNKSIMNNEYLRGWNMVKKLLNYLFPSKRTFRLRYGHYWDDIPLQLQKTMNSIQDGWYKKVN